MSATDATNVAIACQGGGSHTAFTAGVLKRLLSAFPERHELVGLSGTSGGAVCAATAWYGLLLDGSDEAGRRLDSLWEALSARTLPDRAVNEAGVWAAHMEASGVPMARFSPYDTPVSRTAHAALRRVITDHVEFDRVPALLDDDSPRLTISAVDVEDGRFETFTDEAVTVETLLASTAVPHLFRAVELDDGHGHWDGLFAQNPPVTDFLTGRAASAKPDELWIIGINPETRERTPTSLEAIADRRNELSGNLSLRQEVRFVEQVNEWVAEGALPADRYKHVDVRWIRLETDLPYASKLDRRPGFVRELQAHGETQAAAFLDGEV